MCVKDSNYNWAVTRQNLSWVCPTKLDSNHFTQLQRLARKWRQWYNQTYLVTYVSSNQQCEQSILKLWLWSLYSQTSIIRSTRDRRNPFELSVVRMIEIGSFWIFSEKLGCFHRTSLFCQSLHFQLVTSVKVLKKMSSLEASSSLMLCRSKNAEKKRNTTCVYMLRNNIDNNNENKS